MEQERKEIELSRKPEEIQRDFPILCGPKSQPLAYLDSAASAQKPRAVLEAMREFYETSYANIHRGVYELSHKATEAYDAARVKVQQFLGAKESVEIIFTRGTTEGINLVAQSYGRAVLQSGDEVLISHMEHHSNIVPWQILCEQTGAKLKVCEVTESGEIDGASFSSLLSDKTKIVSLVHVSNTLGTINPVKELTRLSHEAGAVVVIDGAQAVPHIPVNVQDIDCDFYAFSGHKLYGPTGIGVLYGKARLLNQMAPYQGGGDMILSVSFQKTTYQKAPQKFEAGTPNIAGAVGLGAAIDYVQGLGFETIQRNEEELRDYAVIELEKVPGIRFVGTAKEKVGVISFVLSNAHPHDIGTVLDKYGVAIRTGHHCTQPLMERFKVPATARASFGVYSTKEDVNQLVFALGKVKEIFK